MSGPNRKKGRKNSSPWYQSTWISGLLLLALAGYLLYCLRDQKEDHLVTEILVQEMVSERPILLPPPQAEMAAIADQSKPTPPLIAQADADQEKNSSE